jgi:hypothetical protein
LSFSFDGRRNVLHFSRRGQYNRVCAPAPDTIEQ